jgi:hypothetical protein
MPLVPGLLALLLLGMRPLLRTCALLLRMWPLLRS